MNAAHKTPSVSRRNFMHLGGAGLAFGGLMSACSTSTRTGGSDVAATKEFSFSWWGATERNELTQEVINLYQSKNPDVTINGTYSGYSNYHDQLTTQAAGSNAPDMMQIQQTFLADFSSRGILADLEQFRDILQLDDYDTGALDSGTFDGTLRALSFGDSALGMFTDFTVLEEAGISIPDPDWTWDDFAEFCEEVARRVGGGYYGTSDFSGNAWALEVFARQLQDGIGVFDEADMALQADTLTEWFTYWQDLRNTGVVVSPEITAEQTSGEDSPLVLQRAPNLVEYAVLMDRLAGSAENNIGLLPLPNIDASKPTSQQWVQGSSWMTIFSESEAQEEVAHFANFFLNDVEAAQILRLDRGIPTNATVREEIAPTLDEVDRVALEYVEYVRGASENLGYKVGPGSAAVDTALNAVSEGLAYGTLTIPEAVDKFFTDTQQ